MKICSVNGCGRAYSAKGYCSLHYKRVYERNKEVGPSDLLVAKRGTPKKGVSGYITIYNKLEHVLVAEKALGKALPEGAEVHHIDGNPSNNDSRNLVICPNHAYHFLIEARTRAYKACGNPNWAKCRYC